MYEGRRCRRVRPSLHAMRSASTLPSPPPSFVRPSSDFQSPAVDDGAVVPESRTVVVAAARPRLPTVQCWWTRNDDGDVDETLVVVLGGSTRVLLSLPPAHSRSVRHSIRPNSAPIANLSSKLLLRAWWTWRGGVWRRVIYGVWFSLRLSLVESTNRQRKECQLGGAYTRVVEKLREKSRHRYLVAGVFSLCFFELLFSLSFFDALVVALLLPPVDFCTGLLLNLINICLVYSIYSFSSPIHSLLRCLISPPPFLGPLPPHLPAFRVRAPHNAFKKCELSFFFLNKMDN